MPLLPSSLQMPAAVPGVQSGSLGLFAGFVVQFATVSALTTAVTANRTDPLWSDGQPLMVAAEAASSTYREWSTSLSHARTIVLPTGVKYVLAADANAVLAGAGAPSGGTGANGDISVDLDAQVVYLKTSGTWALALTYGVSNDSRIDSLSAAYTFALTDRGRKKYHPSSDATARVWTIPANASVAFPVGSLLAGQVANGAGNITLAITTDTLRQVGTGTTGSIVLGPHGSFVAEKVEPTLWYVTAVGTV